MPDDTQPTKPVKQQQSVPAKKTEQEAS